MINHGRTLILNESPIGRPALGTFGEEYVPTDYMPLDYPTDLVAIRQSLIGAAGDPLYQNYRLAQLMAVAHANQYCRDYLLSLDPRYTYRPFSVKFSDIVVGNVIDPLDAKGMTLSATGIPQSNDATGRAMFQWQVTTENHSGASLLLQPLGTTLATHYPLTLVGEDCAPVTLENGISLQLHVPIGGWLPGAMWMVTSVSRPTSDLSLVLATAGALVRAIGQVVLDVPASFKLLWTKGVSQADRFGGLIGAFVYKAEQVRLRVND